MSKEILNQIKRANYSARKQGHSLGGRLAICTSALVGALIGRKLGMAKGECCTRFLLVRAALILPIPFGNLLANGMAKRWGSKVGPQVGILLGATFAVLMTKFLLCSLQSRRYAIASLCERNLKRKPVGRVSLTSKFLRLV